MPSRDELEQEVDILSAELEEKNRELHQLRAELAAAKGTATALAIKARDAGVELEQTPEEVERQALDDTRKAIETDLQALDELHNPPAPEIDRERPMTSLEVVQHNNNLRASLERSLSGAGQIISRIASIVRIDKWSPDGREIIDAVQRFEHLSWYISRKRTEVEREVAKLPKHATAERAELAGWRRALDWASEKLAMPPALVTSAIPISAPDGLRAENGDGTDSILRKRGDTGDLEVVICRGDAVERRARVTPEQLAAEGYGFSQFIKPDDDTDQPYR